MSNSCVPYSSCMDYDTHSLTPIGITNFRNSNKRFGIKDADKLYHGLILGKTGCGKSTLIKNMVRSDMEKGKNCAVIDPHGQLAEELLALVPEHRNNDLVYFNPASDTPLSFNPLHGVHPKYHHLAASGLISTFKNIFFDSWGPRMEYILRFTLLTLLEVPGATLLDIQPLLTDEDYRKQALTYVRNTHTLNFWIIEYYSYTKSFRNEAISPILNKMGIFLSSAPLRNVVGQKTRSFRMQQVLDGKLFIANLSKGAVGEDVCALLGGMLISAMQLAALHRSAEPEHLRKPFYLYVDEISTFVNLSFVGMLSECKKYKLGVFMAGQYLDQLHEKVRAAILGNIGTLISFRIGATDAEYLAKEFYPVFSAEDFVHLPRYAMYIRLMIDGATSEGFSANAIPNVKL